MVNVSKKELPEKTKKELLEQLASIITAQDNSRSSKSLLYELFTPSERLLFIKRIGVIALLHRNYSAYTISTVLNVSQTTVAKIALAREQGHYKVIEDTLARKEHRASIIKTIESLLLLGVPGQANKRLKKRIRADIETWKAGGA